MKEHLVVRSKELDLAVRILETYILVLMVNGIVIAGKNLNFKRY